MTAKEQLRKYSDIKRNIERIKQRIETVEAKICKCTTHTDKVIVQGGDGDKTDLISLYIELKSKYQQELSRSLRYCLEIETRLESMEDGIDKRLLRAKYLYFETFEQIAVKEHMCWRHIMRIHKRALRKYQEITKGAGNC